MVATTILWVGALARDWAVDLTVDLVGLGEREYRQSQITIAIAYQTAWKIVGIKQILISFVSSPSVVRIHCFAAQRCPRFSASLLAVDVHII